MPRFKVKGDSHIKYSGRLLAPGEEITLSPEEAQESILKHLEPVRAEVSKEPKAEETKPGPDKKVKKKATKKKRR